MMGVKQGSTSSPPPPKGCAGGPKVVLPAALLLAARTLTSSSSCSCLTHLARIPVHTLKPPTAALPLNRRPLSSPPPHTQPHAVFRTHIITCMHSPLTTRLPRQSPNQQSGIITQYRMRAEKHTASASIQTQIACAWPQVSFQTTRQKQQEELIRPANMAPTRAAC